MTTTLPVIPIVIGGFVFVRDEAQARLTDSSVIAQWNCTGPDGERLFELTNQPNPDGESDWGIWSLVEDDWAHNTTGYSTLFEATNAFLTWAKDNT